MSIFGAEDAGWRRKTLDPRADIVHVRVCAPGSELTRAEKPRKLRHCSTWMAVVHRNSLAIRTMVTVNCQLALTVPSRLPATFDVPPARLR
jgi:hypothetical protein